MIIEARMYTGAFGSVTAITTANRAPSAEEVNHLWPSMIQEPSRSNAVVDIQVGLEPGRSGSVIEKQLRISPAASGLSHRSFCLSVPNWSSSSMLPTSGAWPFTQ